MSALGYALSQTVFITKIFRVVESDDLTRSVSRSAILAAGATNLWQLSNDANVVRQVQVAYMSGIKDVLILALASACLAHLPLLGMEWMKYPRRGTVHAERLGDQGLDRGGVGRGTDETVA